MKAKTFIMYLAIILSFVISLILIAHFANDALFNHNDYIDNHSKLTKDGIEYSEDGYILNYNGDSKEFVIPVQIKNVKIKKIGSSFLHKKSIDRLEMPSTIEYIAENTFKYTEIKNFYYTGTIEDWCNIEKTYYDIKIKNLYLLNGNKYELFTKVVASNSINYKYAFRFIHSIREVIFEEGIKTIDKSSFEGCVNLEKVVIPNTVTKFTSSFRGCDALLELTIPSSVVEIDNIFCPNLKRVYLPSHLKEFEDEFKNDGNCEIEFIYYD